MLPLVADASGTASLAPVKVPPVRYVAEDIEGYFLTPDDDTIASI